jgi:hypothetical protein
MPMSKPRWLIAAPVGIGAVVVALAAPRALFSQIELLFGVGLIALSAMAFSRSPQRRSSLSDLPWIKGSSQARPIEPKK